MFKSKQELVDFLDLIEAFLKRGESIKDSTTFILALDSYSAIWIKE